MAQSKVSIVKHSGTCIYPWYLSVLGLGIIWAESETLVLGFG